jgi:DNA-binding CsgD family transcriptional regulator
MKSYDMLTPRQKEVLEWLMKGANNKQIAKRLNIALSTVKMHIGAILKAYGAFSRSQLLLTVATNQDIEVEVVLNKTLEEQPFGCVKLTPYGIGGFVMGATSPGAGWHPVYLRKTK